MNESTKVKTKKERKFKPNIIDFLVVVIIIGAIVGIVLRSGVVEDVVGTSLEKVRVSFRVADVADTTASCFKTGDMFYSTTHDCEFGTLENVAVNPAELYVVDQEGKLIKRGAIDNHVDLRGTLVCEGTFNKDGFFLLAGSNYIAPNSEVYVKSANVTARLTVTDIEPVAETEQ